MTKITPEQLEDLENLRPWDATPILTNHSLKKLYPVAQNNDTLVEFLQSSGATENALKKIILIEFVIRPFRRSYVVERCMGKINTLQRERAERTLNKFYYVRKRH